jgi:fermentation-respiration switch protein FrsA (DUF1100 family)
MSAEGRSARRVGGPRRRRRLQTVAGGAYRSEVRESSNEVEVRPAQRRRFGFWKAVRRGGGRWRWVRWTVRVAALAWIAGAFMVGCDSFFYYPSQRVWDSPGDFGLRSEDVRFRTSDGVLLHGWFLPADHGARAHDASRAARGTVVHFHGNAENITAHLALVEWLPRRGFNLLMFDYRGYGESQGRVSRAGTIRDGHAALDYALSRPDVDPQRVFAFGQSLGGAVAVVVAAERPEFRAVVVESAFGRYRGIAACHLRRTMRWEAPARWLAGSLISGGHDPIDVVGRIAPRPLLVLTAERDAICLPELGRELYEAAGEPREYRLIADAGHLELSTVGGTALHQEICDWLERAAENAPAGRP